MVEQSAGCRHVTSSLRRFRGCAIQLGDFCLVFSGPDRVLRLTILTPKNVLLYLINNLGFFRHSVSNTAFSSPRPKLRVDRLTTCHRWWFPPGPLV
jgi:hypothetical protein